MKGTLGNMMQQVQKLQQQMEQNQKDLATKKVVGKAGGDIVSVTMNGQQQVKSINIDHDMIDGDMEMMEDLLIAAFNDALNKVSELQQLDMGALTEGMQLPPGFKMPF